MELIKHQLFGQDQLIHQASFSRKLLEFDSNELKILLTCEYLKFNLKAGREPKNEDETMFEINLFREEILEYKWMTEEQLKLIFAKALKGEFGDDVIYFSIANFHKWAKKFYQEIQRVEMKAIEAERKEETKPMPSDEELKANAIQTINDYVHSVKKYKDRGREYVFPFGGLHHLFDYAQKFGIINMTKEEKLEILNKIGPKLPQEARVQMAKGQAYINFIYQLVDLDTELNEEGKPKI